MGGKDTLLLLLGVVFGEGALRAPRGPLTSQLNKWKRRARSALCCCFFSSLARLVQGKPGGQRLIASLLFTDPTHSLAWCHLVYSHFRSLTAGRGREGKAGRGRGARLRAEP